MNKLIMKAAEQNIDVTEDGFMEEMQPILEQELAQKLSSYTSLAERWGNRMLENMKMEFNLKEVREEMLADLLKAGRLYSHVYEDNSPLGFNVEVINPVDFFELTLPSKKYTKESYVAGFLEILEVSQIIEKHKINKKQVDALLDRNNRLTRATGDYYAQNHGYYNPVVDEMREMDAQIKSDLEAQLSYGSNKYTFSQGAKFLCLTVYWKGKVKVGKLGYWDEDGNPQIAFVDENYKSGDHPQEFDLEWSYSDQIYKGTKIGDYLYNIEEINFTERIPIAGGRFDPKNSSVKAFIDYMRPIQVLINIVANQLLQLLKKEKGVEIVQDLRRIPVGKDSELEDAIQEYEEQTDITGTRYEDNSPDNRKVPGDTSGQTRVIDASRTNEIQSRINLWMQLKAECWEMVGFSRERAGNIAASTTATGIQAATAASYSQTEPWMTFHEYVINDLYQLILDTAQYYESQKEESTVSYISGEGEQAFIKVNGTDLSLRDLRVFVTSRSEDWQTLQDARNLGTEMLQNGVSAADVFKMRNSKSVRGIEDVLNRVKTLQENMQQQAQQIEQQKVEAIQQQTQLMADMEQAKLEREDLNRQLDRESRERVAAISATSKDTSSVDMDNNNIPDVMDILKTGLDENKINKEHQARLAAIQAGNQANILKNATALEKLKLEADKNRLMISENEKDRNLKREELATAKEIAKRNKN